MTRRYGELENWLSLLGGGVLVAYGLARRSIVGTLLALLGGDLIYHGLARGDKHIHQVFGLDLPLEALAVEPAPRHVGIRIQRSVTINRSPEELYRFWRNPENLVRVFDHIRSIKAIDGANSHWVANTARGVAVEWDSEITEDIPGRLIAWQSVAGSIVANSGSVQFVKSITGRGSRVSVTLEYEPRPGAAGEAFLALLGESPSQTVRTQLSRLKQMLETKKSSPFRLSLVLLWRANNGKAS